MHSRTAFIWITVAAAVGAILSQVFDWEWVRNGILIAWVVLVLVVIMTRGMRWTSALTFGSAAALLGAMASELGGFRPGAAGSFSRGPSCCCR